MWAFSLCHHLLISSNMVLKFSSVFPFSLYFHSSWSKTCPHYFHRISNLFLNNFVLSYLLRSCKHHLIILYIFFMISTQINCEIQQMHKSCLNGSSEPKWTININLWSQIAINLINFFSNVHFNFMFVHFVITVICNL